MTKKLWVAVDIGCLECGEGSDVLGLFKTAEEAQAVADAAERRHSRNWHGEHHFEIYEVEAPE